jgi:endonuclease-3
MQRQIHGVPRRGMVAVDGAIDPERQVRERPRGEGKPERAGEQRVIVELERGPEASTECDGGSAEEKYGTPGRDNISVPNLEAATPPKLVPRPKTAAERKARLGKILALLDEMYPNATCALVHRDAWELLAATILSAQCTDKRVNEVTPGLFRKYPTVTDLAHANQAELAQDIRSTGFFNNKAKSLIGAARRLLADFGGKVPRSMEELLTVPGAARKTANVVLGTAYGIASGVVVDTHVLRVSRRLDLTRQTDPVKVERDLIKILPREKWILFSHQIIYHGRALCIARNPKCAECRIDPLCYAKDKNF